MKKYIVSMMLLLPMMFGCKKTSGPEILPVDGEKMTFDASFLETRSHFGSDPSSSQLYWDDTDRIAVYCAPVEDVLVSEYHYMRAVSEAIDVAHISDDGINATFISSKNKADWFVDPISTPQYFQNLYTYFAYYPCKGEPGEILSYTTSDNLSFQYIPVTVPVEQDGSSYWDYQLLFDPGLPEDEDDLTAQDLIMKPRVLNDEQQVTINRLAPVNALFRFTLQLPAGSDSKKLSSLRISLDNDPDHHSIAGPAQLRLFKYGEGQDTVPTAWDREKGDEYLVSVEENTNVITIPTSLTVSEDASDYLYAVLIPFRTECSTLSLRFTAKDVDGNFYVARYALPSWQGEKAEDIFYGYRGGRRYNGAVTLTPVEIDPDSAHAGEYEDGGQNPFTEID